MTSHLIQVLLPLADNTGKAYPDAALEDIKEALVGKFGGVTAHANAPAEGVWAPDGARKEHDEVIMVEVMAENLDHVWWKTFREGLERNLRQKEIVVRAFRIDRL